MASPLKFALLLLAPLALSLLPGCETPTREFTPNGAGANLPPTNPAHIQLLDAVPRNGMVIGTLLVDRVQGGNTAGIVALAKQKAAAAGGDFIIWEGSQGTIPNTIAVPAPGQTAAAAQQQADSAEVGHNPTSFNGPDAAAPNTGTFFHSDKSPKAQFTVGLFMQQ